MGRLVDVGRTGTGLGSARRTCPEGYRNALRSSPPRCEPSWGRAGTLTRSGALEVAEILAQRHRTLVARWRCAERRSYLFVVPTLRPPRQRIPSYPCAPSRALRAMEREGRVPGGSWRAAARIAITRALQSARWILRQEASVRADRAAAFAVARSRAAIDRRVAAEQAANILGVVLAGTMARVRAVIPELEQALVRVTGSGTLDGRWSARRRRRWR
jgi:hypothetical protein